jgi:hypothetical protein
MLLPAPGDAPVFGELETIKVSGLAVGDWIETFPAQRGIRAKAVQSGVAAIEPAPDSWYTRTRPRGPRWPVAASRITCLRAGAGLNVPDDCDVIVRRRLDGTAR